MTSPLTYDGYEPLIESARDVNGTVTACYVGITPFETVEGTHPLMFQESPIILSGGYVFTKALTDLQLGADFLDVYYSDDSFSLINYGTEGVNFEWVDGKRRWLKIYSAVDGEMDGGYIPVDADNSRRFIYEKLGERTAFGQLLYSGELFPNMTIDSLNAQFDLLETYDEFYAWRQPKVEQAKALIRNWQYYAALEISDYLSFPTKDELERMDQTMDMVSAKSDAFLLALARGEYSVDDLPTIVKTLDELGLSDLLEIYQKRYNRFCGF